MKNNKAKHNFLTIFALAFVGVLSLVLLTFFIFDIVPDASLPGIGKLTSNIQNEIAKIVIAVLFALLFIVSTYTFYVGLYIFIKKRNPKAKFKAEVIVFSITFAITLIIKIIILSLFDNPRGSEDGFAKVLYIFYRSFYMTLGGVSFEGVSDLPQTATASTQALYFSSSVIFGLMAVTMVAFKAFYEVYCYFQIAVFYKVNKLIHNIFYRLRYWFFGLQNIIITIVYKTIYRNNPAKHEELRKKKRQNKLKRYEPDIFVFTDLNEETFYIATSVERKYEADNRKYMIVFTGPNLEPFDRKNELCCEAMGRGFLYWSYSQNNKTNIPRVLHFHHKSNSLSHKFYIFAFDVDENMLPKEEENAQFALDDLVHREDSLYVTYVIYARKTIHYRAYEKFFAVTKQPHEEKDLKKCNSRKEKQEAKIYNKYKDFTKSDVIAWSEPQGVADQVSYILKHNKRLFCIEPNVANTYMWAIGCGRTGEAISKALYIYSANMDDDRNSSQFLCMAFDDKASKKVSLVEHDNPYAICIDKGVVEKEMNLYRDSKKDVADTIKEKISELNPNKYVSIVVKTEENKEQPENIIEQVTVIDNSDQKEETSQTYDVVYNEKTSTQEEKNRFKAYRKGDIAEAIRWIIEEKKKNIITSYRSKLADIKFETMLGKKDIDEAKEIINIELNKFACFPTYVGIPSDVYKIDFHKEVPDVYERGEPDFISIAAGNDVKNIEIANSLVNYYRKNPSVLLNKKVVIFVTIYNRKNNFLVSDYKDYNDKNEPLTHGEKKIISHLNDSLFVVIVGNREDTFRYDKIVFDEKAVEVNYRYCILANKMNKKREDEIQKEIDDYKSKVTNKYSSQSKKINKIISNSNKELEELREFKEKYIPYIDELENELHSYLLSNPVNGKEVDLSVKLDPTERHINPYSREEEIDESKLLKYWYDQTLWKKSSSNSAFIFAPTYSYLAYDELQKEDVDGQKWNISKKLLLKLIEIEHQRWARFHFVAGWCFAPEQTDGDKDFRERFKHHKSLLPYSLINPDTYRYDIANVIFAIQTTFSEAKKEKDARRPKPATFKPTQNEKNDLTK